MLTEGPRRSDLPGLVLVTYALVAGIVLLLQSWSMPIVDAHGFRQTQTALSALWITREHSLVNYTTPILGAPWSIPFEFPVYQTVVASLSSATGLGIDHSGRLVSVLFQLGAGWFIYRLVLRLSGARDLALLSAGTFLAAPLGLFWGRSVMIESTAVFFGVLFLWALAALRDERHAGYGLCAVLAAVSSTLVKVTTFYGFAVFACLGLAWWFFRERGWRAQWLRSQAVVLVCAVVAVVSALVALKLWLLHADSLKLQTTWGGNLTSKALERWNYGTLAQRLDPDTWRNVAFGRALQDTMGKSWVFLVALIAVLTGRGTRIPGLLLLLAYLAPFLTFTNLQIVHEYYAFANYAFATAIVALALWRVTRLENRFSVLPATLLALWLCVLSWHRLERNYLPRMEAAGVPTRVSEVARFIGEHTQPQGVVIAFGLDWSSELAYFADRRTIMLPDWTPVEALKRLAEGDESALGGLALAAVVDCPNKLHDDPKRSNYYSRILERRPTGASAEIASCKIWFAQH